VRPLHLIDVWVLMLGRICKNGTLRTTLKEWRNYPDPVDHKSSNFSETYKRNEDKHALPGIKKYEQIPKN
jgi:hypothetical protein